MKETWYFSHDYNARDDEKIKNLVYKKGMEGYGVFWCIIEDLYQNEGSLGYDCKRIAYELHVDEGLVESVINDFNLFTLHGMQIKSASVLRRLNSRKSISKKRQKAANTRWKQQGANALQKKCKSNAIKESKVKESKVKNITSNEVIVTPKKYGNEKINKFYETIKQLTGLSPVAGKQSRQYASNFLKALKKEYKDKDEVVLAENIVKASLALKDNWHSTKCNDPKHLFYNWQEIILKTKNLKNDNATY